jgi:hypothetical protein
MRMSACGVVRVYVSARNGQRDKCGPFVGGDRGASPCRHRLARSIVPRQAVLLAEQSVVVHRRDRRDRTGDVIMGQGGPPRGKPSWTGGTRPTCTQSETGRQTLTQGAHTHRHEHACRHTKAHTSTGAQANAYIYLHTLMHRRIYAQRHIHIHIHTGTRTQACA